VLDAAIGTAVPTNLHGNNSSCLNLSTVLLPLLLLLLLLLCSGCCATAGRRPGMHDRVLLQTDFADANRSHVIFGH
jgi:hypothetical protein